MLVNKLNISGSLTSKKLINSGTLRSLRAIMSGSSSIPDVIDRTQIHYDTTEAWNSEPETIARKGHLYVYSDYIKKENDDGTVTNIPAIKIGDGTSYLIDMPFVVSDFDSEAFEEHIKNWEIHVASDDRESWDNKIAVDINERAENLIFTTE